MTQSMPQACYQHPAVPATYRCDGCEKPLCVDCVEESHVLILCKLCGERALPLYGGQATSAATLRKRRVMAAPYGLADALSFPLRGGGVFMYAAVLLTLTFLYVVRLILTLSLFGGCISIAIGLAFMGMIIGLQFKIVRTTAEGDNDVPDWPDYTDIGTLFQDLLTWIVIHAFMYGAVIWFLVRGAQQGVLELEPRLDFWLLFALVLWLCTAFMVMAYGAVGNYRRLKVFELQNHVRGFFTGGADAIKITNIAFVMGAAVLVIRPILETIPILGDALSGMIWVYWLFLVPHLSGLLFRWHHEKMDEYYWSSFTGA